MLRRPQLNNPDEMRTDPLWEFGSFGCTGCHRKSLMNPRKLTEVDGVRFAFAQGGPYGFKLVHLTPPVRTIDHGSFGEAKWLPAEMPLTYASAPTLLENRGSSDIPDLLDMLRGVRRSSPEAKFASKFRTRRLPLPASISEQMIEVYELARSDHGSIAQSYVDALPWPPPRVDADREATYRRLLQESAIANFASNVTTRRHRSCDHC